MASADAPMKGIATLLEAFAKLRTERDDLELLLVTKPQPGGRTDQLVDRLAIRDHVRFVHGVSDAELVELMGSAEVACVPSPLRGLLAADRRADGLRAPRWWSRDAGAIPEVVGPDGLCADLVAARRRRRAGRRAGARCSTTPSAARATAPPAGRRVEELFSWRAVAAATAAAYEEARSTSSRTGATC